MVLLANTIISPSHDSAPLDRSLCEQTNEAFEPCVTAVQDRAFEAACKIVLELSRKADQSTENALCYQTSHDGNILPDFGAEWDAFLEDWNLATFPIDSDLLFNPFGSSEPETTSFGHTPS